MIKERCWFYFPHRIIFCFFPANLMSSTYTDKNNLFHGVRISNPCSTVDFFPWAACIFRMCRKRLPNSQNNAQSGHCLFEEVSWNSKISVLPISVMKSLDSWLKWLISSAFSKSFSNMFLFGCLSNCSINRCTFSFRFVSTCSTVEFGMPRIRKSTRPLPQVRLWTSFSRCHLIFSIPKQVHPSERDASSAQVLREVTLVTGIFCSKVLP